MINWSDELSPMGTVMKHSLWTNSEIFENVGGKLSVFLCTGRMLFRLSHKSRSVVNGVRIRLSQSQSILSPSLTSHLPPYTLHARFGTVVSLSKFQFTKFLAVKTVSRKTPGHLSSLHKVFTRSWLNWCWQNCQNVTFGLKVKSKCHEKTCRH